LVKAPFGRPDQEAQSERGPLSVFADLVAKLRGKCGDRQARGLASAGTGKCLGVADRRGIGSSCDVAANLVAADGGGARE
jgi:hypothetical protein